MFTKNLYTKKTILQRYVKIELDSDLKIIGLSK